MKKIFITLFALLAYTVTQAQSNELIGQYFLNMPSYNPAHTGVDNFTNVSAGMRQQWTGFSGSPYNSFVNGYAVIGSHPDSVGITPKHGIGANIMMNGQGAYKQQEVALMYAYHVPLAKNTYLSFGMSPTLYTERIQMSKLTVEDDINDAAYQSLMNGAHSYTNLKLSAGLALYSDRFYVSYSLRDAAKLSESGNEEVFNRQTEKRHHIMAGYTFHINDRLDLIPNSFLRLDRLRPALFEAGLRASMDRNKWLGVSVRNDNTVMGTLGMVVRNKFSFGYAYEHKKFGIASTAGGTHELVLGLQLQKL